MQYVTGTRPVSSLLGINKFLLCNIIDRGRWILGISAGGQVYKRWDKYEWRAISWDEKTVRRRSSSIVELVEEELEVIGLNI